MSALSQPKVLVFGYGSNGVAQLRARCANPALTLRPARLPDHARVFCLRSPRWGQGGVASLAPAPNQHCLGSVAELSVEEKELLDRFEKLNFQIILSLRHRPVWVVQQRTLVHENTQSC